MRGAKHRVDVDVGDLRFLDWATIDWRSGGWVHIAGRFCSVDRLVGRFLCLLKATSGPLICESDVIYLWSRGCSHSFILFFLLPEPCFGFMVPIAFFTGLTKLRFYLGLSCEYF
ncbi:MAG: hypothetical protein ACI9ND_001268, partial [Yoonia sp.]